MIITCNLLGSMINHNTAFRILCNWEYNISREVNISLIFCACHSQRQFASVLTGELRLPIRQALPLRSVQVRQVIMFVLQGVLLQTEGRQASGCISASKHSVRAIWHQDMIVFYWKCSFISAFQTSSFIIAVKLFRNHCECHSVT